MEGASESGDGDASSTGTAPWRGGSGSDNTNNSSGSGTGESSSASGNLGAPPPPPPVLPTTGGLPAVRLNSEIGPRDRGPPAALANAMTKDKKPFTYTPGGLDLSEIRSPRMAKRLQMNAASEGVTGPPKGAPTPPTPGSGLSPAALAAMQPQMAVSVFPQGAPPTLKQVRQRPMMEISGDQEIERAPSPRQAPVKMVPPSPAPAMPPQLLEQIHARACPPQPRVPPPPPPQMMMMELPTPPVLTPTQQTAPIIPMKQNITPVKPVEEVRTNGSYNYNPNVGTGSIYIPPVSQMSQHPSPPQLQASQTRQTKAQAASQNLGHIYIPPVEQVSQRPVESTYLRSPSPEGPPGTGSNRSPPSTGSGIQTPQLNKAPMPWMSSYNRRQVDEMPPQGNGNVTPWGTLVTGPGVRTVPISFASDDSQTPPTPTPTQPYMQTSSSPITPQNSKAKAAQTLGRIIPIQMQRQQSLKEEQIQHQQQLWNQGRGRTIPIKVEGRSTPQSPGADLASGVSKISLNNEGARMEPAQSKSLRVVQKVAENDLQRLSSMDEMQQGGASGWDWEWQQPMATPSWMNELGFTDNYYDTGSAQGTGQRSPIPSKTFKTLQNSLPPSTGAENMARSQNPAGQVQANSGPVMFNIPVQFSSSSPATSPLPQQEASSSVPPSEQRPPSPKMYMGSKIPSRSFKMLQAMTGPEDPEASSSMIDTSFGTSGTVDANNYSQFPPPSPCPSPFPLDYMAWYYWWYYVSCYWAGYDMSGLEYPVGWDPENPYCPPEIYATYYQNQNYDSNATDDDEQQQGALTYECENQVEDETLCENKGDESGTEAESLSISGIVEEPSTTEDSDATIVDDGILSPSCLIIEEYRSSSESESNLGPQQNRRHLTTIEEMTDEWFSSRGSTPRTPAPLPKDSTPEKHENEEKDEEESSSSEEEDEVSSASVIENKSASQQSMSISATEEPSSSKREESTSSSSDEDEEDIDDMAAAAVTVRLPLQLSFGKSKSYKDITTVLVGDSEIQSGTNEEPENLKPLEEESVKLVENEDYESEEDNDDEPVVSFTFSLSQPLTANKSTKNDDEDDTDNEAEKEDENDIDFWGQINAKEEPNVKEEEKKNTEFSPIEDYWGSLVTESTQSVKEEDKKDTKEEQLVAVEDYWGTSENVEPESTVVVKMRRHAKPTEQISIPLRKVGTSWDNEFNFWEKKHRPIEVRRFSGSFEITEDYESDSGMKSDSGQRHRQRHKVKRYKKRSIPAGLPLSKSKSKSCNWMDKTSLVETPKEEEFGKMKSPSESETQLQLEEAQDDGKIEMVPLSPGSPKEKADFSTGWSFWDDYERDVQATVQETTPDTDVQVTLPIEKNVEKVVTEENSNSSSSGSGVTVRGVNEDESSKATNVEPASLTAESSSSEDNNKLAVEAMEDSRESQDEQEPIENVEKQLEIQSLSESIKLHNESHLAHTHSCTCQIDDRISRAESLLWRIERFLHESLSLGSEGDSGVMTDLSRPVSDVDTDPDDSHKEPEVPPPPPVLTSLPPHPPVVMRRNNNPESSRSLREQAATNSSNPNNRRARPQSLIILESTTSKTDFPELSGARVRSNSAERKKYQKAKTHSRLFQLLQDESFKDEDDEEEFFDCESSTSKTPLHFSQEETILSSMSSTNTKMSSSKRVGFELHVDTNTTTATTATSSFSSTMEARRSRLLPLPIKSITSTNSNNNNSNNTDTSTSSPSGSSGVLSPTSPQQRDKFLAGIINEFHQRQRAEFSSATYSKRFSKFPSKIFKMLQDEFGEEFYQTFNCGGEGILSINPGDLLLQSHESPQLLSSPPQEHPLSSSSYHCHFHEDKHDEVAINSTTTANSSSGEFLNVPASYAPPVGPRRRDFRVPKSRHQN